MLVAYGQEASDMLELSGIDGQFINMTWQKRDIPVDLDDFLS